MFVVLDTACIKTVHKITLYSAQFKQVFVHNYALLH